MKFNRKLQKKVLLFAVLFIAVVAGLYLFSITNKSETFMSHKSSKPKFVLYYANWCPHCKVMMPEWEKLMQTYKGPVHIKKIDCALPEHKNVAKKNGVSSFPTLLLHYGGKKI